MEQLSVPVQGGRMTIQIDTQTARLWLVEIGPKETWRSELSGDMMVWRTSPERGEREWLVAGDLRGPLPSDVRDVRVTLTPSGRVFTAALTESAFVVVLPPDADQDAVTVSWLDPSGQVYEEVLLNPPSMPLAERLGDNPDGDGWTHYGPLME